MSKLKDAVSEINSSAGHEIAFLGGENDEAISTGIMPLDVAIGIGGLPKGRIIEVHGNFSVGKTALCLSMVSNFQKQGLNCAYIDVEYAFNYDYARNMGVETDELLIVKPDTAEQAFEAIEKIVRAKQIQIIVVDSVSALVTKSEAEAEHGKVTIGSQAKIISKGLAKIVGPLHKNGAILIFINQLRMNIMGGQYDQYVLPGGMALRFYSSVMLELHRKGALMQAEKQVGIEIEIVVKKNKVGPPNERCLVQLLYQSGFSAEADILAMGEKMGVIQHEGNTYLFKGQKLGVGQSKARKFLETSPEIVEEIKDRIKDMGKSKETPVV